MAGTHENTEDMGTVVAPVRHMKVLDKAARCNFCRKLFCCIKCRMEHEKNKHFTSNYKSENEVYSSDEFREKHYLSYAILENDQLDKHFPLKCVYCSLIFESRTDLENLLSTKLPCLPQVRDRCHLLVASHKKGKHQEFLGKRKYSATRTSTPAIANEPAGCSTFPSRPVLMAGRRRSKTSVKSPVDASKNHACAVTRVVEKGLNSDDSLDNQTAYSISKTPDNDCVEVMSIRRGSATSTPYYDANSFLTTDDQTTDSDSNYKSAFQCGVSPTDSEVARSGGSTIPTATIRGTPMTSLRQGIMRKSPLESSSKTSKHNRRRVTFHSKNSDSVLQPLVLPSMEETPEEPPVNQNFSCDDNTNAGVLALIPTERKNVKEEHPNITGKIFSAISSAWNFAFFGMKSTICQTTYSECPDSSSSSPRIFHFEGFTPQSSLKKARLSLSSSTESKNNLSLTPRQRKKSYYNIKSREPIAGMRFRR